MSGKNKSVGCGTKPHWYVKYSEGNGWYISNLRQSVGFGACYLRRLGNRDNIPQTSDFVGSNHFFKTRLEARAFKNQWQGLFPAPPVEEKYLAENKTYLTAREKSRNT